LNIAETGTGQTEAQQAHEVEAHQGTRVHMQIKSIINPQYIFTTITVLVNPPVLLT
jgi:hypothetical protein